MSWSVSDEEFSVYANGPLRARPLGALAATMMGVAALAVLLGALAFVRVAPVEPAASAVASASAPIAEESPSPAFSPPPRSAAAPAKRVAGFDIDIPEFAGEKKVVAEAPPQTGGRRETVSIGDFDDGEFFLRFDILQPAGAKLGNSDFFLDMARHAAQAGLAVSRIGQPTPLASRFGALETAEIRLSRSGDGLTRLAAGERSCFAARLVDAKLSIEIAGVACGAATKPVDKRAMGCLLGRLYYVPAGEGSAQGLSQAFARGESASCFAAPAAAPAAESGAPHPSRKKRAARH
jgi:hypothetical protein